MKSERVFICAALQLSILNPWDQPLKVEQFLTFATVIFRSLNSKFNFMKYGF